MLGTKNVQTNAAELASVKVIRPERALSSWKGVRWSEMVDGLKAELQEYGWTVPEERFALYRNGADIVYACRIEGSDLGSYLRRYYPAIAFVASNARRRGLMFYCGMMVPGEPGGFVSSRFMGDKFMNNFTVERQMRTAVGRWKANWTATRARAEQLHLHKESDSIHNNKIVLTEADIQRMLFTAAKEDLMPWSRLRRVAETFDSDREDRVERSAWGLVQAFVRVANSNATYRQLDQVLGFVNIVDKDVNLSRSEARKASQDLLKEALA